MATLTRRVEEVEERTESLETIFAAFMARTDASMARMDASMARTDASMERTGEATARTDERIGHLERIVERMEQEGARSREEAARDRRTMDKRFGALADSIERMEQEGAREREAAAREREEAARERKEMNKRWGELANSMGTVVEDIVAPSIRRLAREVFDCGGLQHFATRTARTRSDAPSHEREFDALYVGTQAVLLNETKASARPEYAGGIREVSGERPVCALLSGVPGVADRAGVLVAEHTGGAGHLPDAARHLRGDDGRRSHAGAQPERGAQAERRTLTARRPDRRYQG